MSDCWSSFDGGLHVVYGMGTSYCRLVSLARTEQTWKPDWIWVQRHIAPAWRHRANPPTLMSRKTFPCTLSSRTLQGWTSGVPVRRTVKQAETPQHTARVCLRGGNMFDKARE